MANKKKYYKKQKSSAGVKALKVFSVAMLLTIVAGTTYVVLDKNDVFAKEKVETKESTNNNVTSSKELEDRIAELESNNKSLNDQLSALTKDKTNLSSQVDSLKATITENESKIDGLNSRIETLRNEKEALEHSNTSNESKIQELNNEITELEDQISQYLNNISCLNSQINNLNSQIETLESQITGLSQDKYVLSISNPEMNITFYDYLHIEEYTDDITSLYSGSATPYQVLRGEIDYSGDKRTAKIYYFNGPSENGAYAIRTVNIDSNTSTYKTLYKGNEFNQYLFVNKGETLKFEDISLKLNSVLFNKDVIYSQISIHTPNGDIVLSQDGTTEYLLNEDEYNYRVSISTSEDWSSFEITTKTSIVSEFGNMYDGYQESDLEYKNSNWDEFGNYIVTLKVYDNENVQITIKKEYFEQYLESQTMGDRFIELSEGYSWASGLGGDVSTGFNFRTPDSKTPYVNFFIEKLNELYEYYVENFQSNNFDFNNATYSPNEIDLNDITSNVEVTDDNTLKFTAIINGETFTETISAENWNSTADTGVIIMPEVNRLIRNYYVASFYMIKHENTKTIEYGVYIYNKTDSDSNMDTDAMGKDATNYVLGTVYIEGV